MLENRKPVEVFENSILFDKIIRGVSSPLSDYLSLQDRQFICKLLKYARERLIEEDDTS